MFTATCTTEPIKSSAAATTINAVSTRIVRLPAIEVGITQAKVSAILLPAMPHLTIPAQMSTYPKSPKEMTRGMMYFPRMLDKIRLHARGELTEDYHRNLGHPK